MLATAKDDTPAVRQVNLGIKHCSDTDGEGGNFACTPLKREELRLLIFFVFHLVSSQLTYPKSPVMIGEQQDTIAYMYVAGNPRDQELVDEAQIWTNATSAILVAAIRFIDILSSLAFSKHWQKKYTSTRVKDAFLVWR